MIEKTTGAKALENIIKEIEILRNELGYNNVEYLDNMLKVAKGDKEAVKANKAHRDTHRETIVRLENLRMERDRLIAKLGNA